MIYGPMEGPWMMLPILVGESIPFVDDVALGLPEKCDKVMSYKLL